MPRLLRRNQRLEGMGGKFTFWEARAMHRSVTHPPRSANTPGSRSPSHLFNPSALRLAMSCWLRKYKPQGCFLEPVSSALLSSRGLPVKRYKVLALLFPLGAAHASSGSSPSLCQPKGAGQLAGRLSVWQGDRSALTTTLHAKGLGKGGGGELGGSGWRTAEITSLDERRGSCALLQSEAIWPILPAAAQG